MSADTHTFFFDSICLARCPCRRQLTEVLLAVLIFVICVRSVDQKVKIVASPKIPKAADAAKHKAGGGNVQICQ